MCNSYLATKTSKEVSQKREFVIIRLNTILTDMDSVFSDTNNFVR